MSFFDKEDPKRAALDEIRKRLGDMHSKSFSKPDAVAITVEDEPEEDAAVRVGAADSEGDESEESPKHDPEMVAQMLKDLSRYLPSKKE